MPRLAFKPDASFFRKIVVGAVGARAVAAGLARRGHRFVELERGSTDTKLWKDVKRKRVRISDLLCINCGRRIECRAKTRLELAMSHSPTDAERAWDFGMIDGDWIAFPVCEAVEEDYWSSGALDGPVAIGGSAMPSLLAGLQENNQHIAAGCAEVLRRGRELPKAIVEGLIVELNASKPQPWAVCLVGHLSREQFATAIAGLQQTKPQLHYALSLLWSFVESWIARNRQLHPMLLTYFKSPIQTVTLTISERLRPWDENGTPPASRPNCPLSSSAY